MSERVLVRKIQHNLWQWREASASGWRSDAFYTGDINLLREAVAQRPVWLVVPGTQVVSQPVVVEVKDRRQLLKILPYEIEETIVDPVENLHFVFGALREDTIPVIYADFAWLQGSIAEVEALGTEVVRCGVDYLQLPRPEGGWTLLLENGILLAHLDDGVGFAMEQAMVAVCLSDLGFTDPPSSLHLYADTAEALATLRDALAPLIAAANLDETAVIAEEAGFWDRVSPSVPLAPDFRTGKLSRRLPFERVWREFKYPIVATAAGLVLAVTAAWMGARHEDQQRRVILAQTDAVFRQVVPEGAISDPERQLRNLLGTSTGGRASQAVHLLTGVSPALKAYSDIKVRSFRYSHDNGQLQLNIEAGSFDTFEALRQKITEAGLQVEIRSASVFGDAHQAQLRVWGAG